MKTAMQELIKWMDDNKSHCTYGTIRGKATELLQSYASNPSPMSAEQVDELGYYYPLFKFFSDEHGLSLLDSQLQDVIHECKKFIEPASPSVKADGWVSVERIICAANYYDDNIERVHQPSNIKTGFVICGRRHNNCINTFAMIMKLPYSTYAHRIQNKEIQGFLTNTNRFVDRKEALIIATNAKQLIHDVKLDSNVGLTSEDIY